MKGSEVLSIIFLALVAIVVAGIVNVATPISLIVPSFVLISLCLWVAYDYILLQRYREKIRKFKQSQDNERPTNKQNTNDSAVVNSEDELMAVINEINNDKDTENSNETITIADLSSNDDQYNMEKELYKADMGLTNSQKIETKIPQLARMNDMQMTYEGVSPDIDMGENTGLLDVPRDLYDKNLLKQQHKNEYDIDMYRGFSDIKELHPLMGGTADTRMANRMKYMGMQAKLSQDIRASYHKPQMQQYFAEELNDAWERSNWWDRDQLEKVF